MILTILRLIFSHDRRCTPVWYEPYPGLGIPAVITARVSLWYRVEYLGEDLRPHYMWLFNPDEEEICQR